MQDSKQRHVFTGLKGFRPATADQIKTHVDAVRSRVIPSIKEEQQAKEKGAQRAKNCLWCSGMISPHQLALEAKTCEERKQQDYGSGQPNPSVITVNAVGAAHAANDFLMSYLGLYKKEVSPHPRRFRHRVRDLVAEEYPPDPECTECGQGAHSRFGRGNAVRLPTMGL